MADTRDARSSASMTSLSGPTSPVYRTQQGGGAGGGGGGNFGQVNGGDQEGSCSGKMPVSYLRARPGVKPSLRNGSGNNGDIIAYSTGDSLPAFAGVLRGRQPTVKENTSDLIAWRGLPGRDNDRKLEAGYMTQCQRGISNHERNEGRKPYESLYHMTDLHHPLETGPQMGSRTPAHCATNVY